MFRQHIVRIAAVFGAVLWAGAAWAGPGGIGGGGVAVPEPATLGILAAGIGGLLIARSRRRK